MIPDTPVWDIVLLQGTDQRPSILYQDANKNPIPLDSASADLQVRTTVDSNLVLLELSTSNGKIILNNPVGTIQLLFAPSDTNMIIPTGAYLKDYGGDVGYAYLLGYYDLKLVVSGQTNRLVKGKVYVSPAITR